ncbi:MAG: hypothetical protein HY878_03660, partial [Deltaproteobacteria bacterium]|nr:hypothetical protein [Deltaproteobacteria bacterium]
VAFVKEKRIVDDAIVKEAVGELDAEGAIQRDLDIPLRKGWRVFRYLTESLRGLAS